MMPRDLEQNKPISESQSLDIEFFIEEILIGFRRNKLSLLDAIDSLIILFWKHFKSSKGRTLFTSLEKWLKRTQKLPKKVKVEKGGHIAVEFEAKITRTAGKTVIIVPKPAVEALKQRKILDERMLVRIKWPSTS